MAFTHLLHFNLDNFTRNIIVKLGMPKQRSLKTVSGWYFKLLVLGIQHLNWFTLIPTFFKSVAGTSAAFAFHILQAKFESQKNTTKHPTLVMLDKSGFHLVFSLLKMKYLCSFERLKVYLTFKSFLRNISTDFFSDSRKPCLQSLSN